MYIRRSTQTSKLVLQRYYNIIDILLIILVVAYFSIVALAPIKLNVNPSSTTSCFSYMFTKSCWTETILFCLHYTPASHQIPVFYQAHSLSQGIAHCLDQCDKWFAVFKSVYLKHCFERVACLYTDYTDSFILDPSAQNRFFISCFKNVENYIQQIYFTDIFQQCFREVFIQCMCRDIWPDCHGELRWSPGFLSALLKQSEWGNWLTATWITHS